MIVVIVMIVIMVGIILKHVDGRHDPQDDDMTHKHTFGISRPVPAPIARYRPWAHKI